MLQLRETRLTYTKHENVLSGVVVQEEGMALVYVKENGETKVQPSTGAAGEVFAGVSFSRNVAPASAPFVQEFAIPASGKLELVRTPIAGQLNVKLGNSQLTVVSGAPADADEVQLSGRTLTFFAGVTGSAAAQFQYTPTVVEARAMLGDGPHGGLSSTSQAVIGTIKNATIATNFYDASQDFSDAMFVKTGPAGTFVPGTANDHIEGVIVKNAPNASNPFLILSLDVA